MTICIWNHGHPMKTDDSITAKRQKWTPITADEFFGDVEDMRRRAIMKNIEQANESSEREAVET